VADPKKNPGQKTGQNPSENETATEPDPKDYSDDYNKRRGEALAPKTPPPPPKTSKYKTGGKVRGSGIESRGKTRGRFV